MIIGEHNVDERIMIIAEIGNNHEGDVALAKEMIALAAEAGADAVKFQTIVPERLVACSQRQRIEQLRKFHLTESEFRELHAVAQDNKVMFLSTPFDLDSVDWLDELVPAFKIASGDNNFYPLIRRIAETGKPIMMSCGMTHMQNVREALERIHTTWGESRIQQEVALLHCVVSYPTPDEQANLRAITTLAECGCTVGYSDHTLGTDAAVLAAALGARILEKHFTINKSYSDFRDHALSADPEELKIIVDRVRRAESMLGDGSKAISPAEAQVVTAVRRSIAAKHAIPKGQAVDITDLMWVRPGEGLAPGEEHQLLGKVAARNLSEGELITTDDVE